jgi:hypothetical protein
MAKWKECRRNRAVHEAAHAVVARVLGREVVRVTIRKSNPHACWASAAYDALTANVAARIEAFEKDAIVSQAGYTADVYEYPHPLDPMFAE